MRQVAKRGILTAVATGSVLASTAGYAYASAEAQGGAANSPGVGSGNAVQAPVDIPVNACGNTVNVVGLLNPAMGNHCANASLRSSGHAGQDQGGSGHQDSGQGASGGSDQRHAGSGSSASGGAHNSPGVASGNHVQAPVNIPVNACGNSVDVVGIGNPAFGNSCGNESSAPTPPPAPGDDCPPGTQNPPPSTTPPVSTLPVSVPPGAGRTGGPTEVTPVSTGSGTVRIPSQSTQSTASATQGQLASTGAAGIELIATTGAALLLAGGVLYRRSRAGAR